MRSRDYALVIGRCVVECKNVLKSGPGTTEASKATEGIKGWAKLEGLRATGHGSATWEGSSRSGNQSTAQWSPGQGPWRTWCLCAGCVAVGQWQGCIDNAIRATLAQTSGGQAWQVGEMGVWQLGLSMPPWHRRSAVRATLARMSGRGNGHVVAAELFVPPWPG